jgi:hypothetical protein
MPSFHSGGSSLGYPGIPSTLKDGYKTWKDHGVMKIKLDMKSENLEYDNTSYQEPVESPKMSSSNLCLFSSPSKSTSLHKWSHQDEKKNIQNESLIKIL